MTFEQSVWLFAAAVTLHNLEEVVWLPRWSHTAGKWHYPVGSFEFRFAVISLTMLVI